MTLVQKTSARWSYILILLQKFPKIKIINESINII